MNSFLDLGSDLKYDIIKNKFQNIKGSQGKFRNMNNCFLILMNQFLKTRTYVLKNTKFTILNLILKF